jgi:N-methylhydantoinase A
MADARKDAARTLLGSEPSATGIRRVFGELHRSGIDELKREGFRRSEIAVHDFLDARYRGQSYELTVGYTRDWTAAFHRRHRARYGHSDHGKPVEIVAARVSCIGTTCKPVLPTLRGRSRNPRPENTGRVFESGRWLAAPIYDRNRLHSQQRVEGPAVIGEYSSTTYVPSGFRASIDRFGNLLLEAE